MRRSKREITDINGIIEVLSECEVINLAMCDNNAPYVLPMNYGFTVEDGRVAIYLHCAMEGKKVDILRSNPNVYFAISRLIKIITAEANHNWTASYKSVIGSGKAEIISDTEEKIKGIHSIMQHSGYAGEAEYSERVMAKTMIIRINVLEITGKANI